MAEDLTEVVGRCDANFKLTFANAAHARMVGAPAEALVGKDFFTGIPPHVAPPLRQRMLALTPERPLDVSENEKILADGSERWFHWTNRALFDAERQLTGDQSVGRDLTDQRRAEAALRERERF